MPTPTETLEAFIVAFEDSHACAFAVATWQEVLEHLQEHAEYVTDSDIKKISIKKINMNKADFEALPEWDGH